MFGNPLSWPFEHWIEQFPDIVIVSVYYRLSIFGFLSAPEGNGLDYNAGLLDQKEALRWIKKVRINSALHIYARTHHVYSYRTSHPLEGILNRLLLMVRVLEVHPYSITYLPAQEKNDCSIKLLRRVYIDPRSICLPILE
jgi:hypothetical protein